MPRVYLSDLDPLPLLDVPRANPLAVTDTQRRLRAMEVKVAFVATMDPVLFLRLTTTNDAHAQMIAESAARLDAYNAWSAQGETLIAPYLEVDMKTGKVVGHEGRHRAAALLAAGEHEMPVGIVLMRAFKDSWGVGHYAVKNRTADDCPPSIRAQFRPRVRVPAGEAFLRVDERDVQGVLPRANPRAASHGARR